MSGRRDVARWLWLYSVSILGNENVEPNTWSGYEGFMTGLVDGKWRGMIVGYTCDGKRRRAS